MHLDNAANPPIPIFSADRCKKRLDIMMRPYLCHHLNSLHIYCRLLDIGIPKRLARRLTGAWERVFHPIVYARPRGG